MKTLITTMALVVALGLQSYATADTTETSKKEQSVKETILSPEQEKLFASGILNEVVIQPTYSTVEQLIFTELVKKAKQQD